MKAVNVIVVRIGNDVRVIFEDQFMDGNPFRTQNTLYASLKLLYPVNYFSVEYFTHYLEDNDKDEKAEN